jgi:rfaE bifunctional protein kinase chain/domain
MVHELELQLTFGKTPRILVIGDIMLDKHVHCEVLGLSPEDDLTPKVRIIREDVSLGGAANVAVNLRKLGAKVMLVGQVGKDGNGHRVDQLLDSNDIENLVWCDQARPTTVKTRYLTPRGRHVIRVDAEETSYSRAFMEWYATTVNFLGELDAIIVSDYAKGVIDSHVLELLRDRYKCPIVVDPKRPLEEYGRIFAATPNHAEFEQYLNVDHLCSYQGAEWVVVTRGAKGCSLIDKRGVTCHNFSVRAREVGDPTGCGDSFVAAFTYAITRGLKIDAACRIGNAAGSVKFDHRGVHAVTIQEIVDEMRRSDESSNPIAGAAGR